MEYLPRSHRLVDGGPVDIPPVCGVDGGVGVVVGGGW